MKIFAESRGTGRNARYGDTDRSGIDPQTKETISELREREEEGGGGERSKASRDTGPREIIAPAPTEPNNYHRVESTSPPTFLYVEIRRVSQIKSSR